MYTRKQAEIAVHHSLGVVLDNPTLSLSPCDHLQHDLGLDSMTFLQLALDLETFLEAPLEEDPERLPQTVKDLIELFFHRMERCPDAT